MRAAIFLVCAVAWVASPRWLTAESIDSRFITVLLDFEKPHSDVSVQAMREELQRILDPAGLKIDLRLKNELSPEPQFPDLVIFKMKGSCTMNALPVAALSDERGALAMAYSSDGEILHFGEVECDRVRQSLQRVLGRGAPERHQKAYGAALGLLVAHEMYHMLGNQKIHTRDGLTKSSLSARELLEDNLTLPIARLQCYTSTNNGNPPSVCLLAGKPRPPEDRSR